MEGAENNPYAGPNAALERPLDEEQRVGIPPVLYDLLPRFASWSSFLALSISVLLILSVIYLVFRVTVVPSRELALPYETWPLLRNGLVMVLLGFLLYLVLRFRKQTLRLREQQSQAGLETWFRSLFRIPWELFLSAAIILFLFSI